MKYKIKNPITIFEEKQNVKKENENQTKKPKKVKLHIIVKI